MGEGRECRPLALVTGAEIEFANRINKKELLIPIEEDVYGPMFRKIGKK